jgi:hypothetical protein
MPSFWLFFGIGSSFFALKQSSNHVFQNFNRSLVLISNFFTLKLLAKKMSKKLKKYFVRKKEALFDFGKKKSVVSK